MAHCWTQQAVCWRPARPSLAAAPDAMAQTTTHYSSVLPDPGSAMLPLLSFRAAMSWVAHHCHASLSTWPLWSCLEPCGWFFISYYFSGLTDLELTLIPLPPPSQCCNYRHELPLPASVQPLKSNSCLRGSGEAARVLWELVPFFSHSQD